MDEDQFDLLVNVANHLIINKKKEPSTQEAKLAFIKAMDDIRVKAQERGLTPEILEQILREDE